MQPRSLRSNRMFRTTASQADPGLLDPGHVPGPDAVVPTGAPLSSVETAPVDQPGAETLTGVLDVVSADSASAVPPQGADLVADAELVPAPRGAEVTRRAQHALKTSGPKVGLVALGLSALTVAALTVGTVQGLRSDQASASAAAGEAVLTNARLADLPDGRQEDVTGARAAAQAGLQAEQQRAQAAAAAAQAAEQQRAQAAAQAQAAAVAAAKARQAAAAQAARSASRTSTSAPVSGGSAQAIAQSMLAQRGWSGQWSCLSSLWQKESGWNYRATNPYSGAYGIPQALPGSKMASAGSDWQTNPATQIAWGLSYIASTYGTPCSAWAHSQATGWY